MKIVIFLLYTILILQVQSQIDCSSANQDQCGVGRCAGYIYDGNRCVSYSGQTCR